MEVLRNNFEAHLDNILEALDKASFVAIDAEFTGTAIQ
jgi:CAF1 family ribonuclease